MNQHPFTIKLRKAFSFYYCANRNKHTIGQSNKKKKNVLFSTIAKVVRDPGMIFTLLQ